MKVLTIVNSLSIGGIEKTLLSCIPHLKKNGIEVEMCVYNLGGILEKEYKKLNIPIHSIKKTRSIIFDYLQVKSILKTNKIDILHSRFGFSSGGFVLAAKNLNIPSIVSIHNTHPPKKGTLIDFLLKIQFKIHKWIHFNFADKIVGHSLSNLNSNYNNWEQNKRFKVIYNGIDFNKMTISKSSFDYDLIQKINDNKVILNIGSFRHQKNHEFMLNVFAGLNPVINNLLLILVGDGENKDKLKRQVNNLNLNEKVIFAGIDVDLKKYFDSSDVFFFPSLQEGFGNVIIEAQFMSLPVCGSNISSLQESIFNDYKNYCFDPKNIVQSRNNLEKMINDNSDGILNQSKLAAKKYVTDNFSVIRMTDELTKLYLDF
jgi:glycosyltransferase EpsF